MRRVSYMALAAAASLMALAFSGGARAGATSSDETTTGALDFADVSVSGGGDRQFVVLADGLSVVASGTLSTTGSANVVVPVGVTGEYQVMVEGDDGRWSTAVVDPFHGFAWDW